MADVPVRRRGTGVARLSIAVMLFAASACATGPHGTMAPLGPPQVTASGMQVLGVPDPSWTLRRLDGTTFTLGDLEGGPVFVNLWATWCPPCVEELGSIARLAHAVEGAGVHFVLASPEDADQVRRFSATNDLTVPLVMEETLAPEAFGELVLPTTAILDREGRMVLLHRGAAAWDAPEIRDLLLALAQEGAG